MTRRVPVAVALLASLVAAPSADARLHRLHPQPPVRSTLTEKSLKSVPAPVITSVVPLKTSVGNKLTILGKNFLKGKNKNEVFFLRQGGGVGSVAAEFATTTRIVVTIPQTLIPLLRSTGAKAVPTRFQIRVLAGRYGDPTKLLKSPVIGPPTTQTPGGGSGGGAGLCGGKVAAGGSTSDRDADLLSNYTELNVSHTDPCKADTDGDGATDGYEFRSALDLNNTMRWNYPPADLAYPGKKPWPNPLDPSDTVIDHDGDGLTLGDEYQLWLYYGHHSFPLNYSDGKQRSSTGADSIPPPGLQYAYMDMDGSGVLTDDERDADNDKLGNWDELYGRMTQGWWDVIMNGSHGRPKETRYVNTFPGTSPTDPDTDGDGVSDGFDDQDHDGYTNIFEISRPWDWRLTYVSGRWPPFIHAGPVAQDFQDFSPPGPLPVGVKANPWARVQPYNPCKPVWSATCHLHWPAGYYGEDEDWPSMDASLAGPMPVAPWMFDPADYHVPGGE